MPLDGDAAALGEVLGADLGLVAEDGDVDEVGAAVLTVLVAPALNREAQPSDLGAAPLVELGFGGESARRSGRRSCVPSLWGSVG